MTDTCRRKPPSNQTLHAVPWQVASLTSTTQNRSPEKTHCHAKGPQCRTVHGHSVITEVAQQDRAQVSPLFRNRPVHALPQFTLECLQLGLPPLPHRLAQNREVPLPGLPTTVRKTQEVERLRLAVTTGSPISFRIAAELDDPRFSGVQLQPELRKALAQFCQKLLCLMTILKTHNEIVSETDHDHITVGSLLSPLVGPKVEPIMEIEVRQQRADTATMNRSYLRVDSLALFQHARVQSFLDQTHDAPVCQAMLDKLHQPSVIQSVIEPPDVGIEHPIHLSRSDPNRQRIQRLVWTTSRSKSVRETQEVLLVDRVQHLASGTLDDLVFQRGNAEWPKLTRFTHLRDVDPTHRLGSVRSPLQPMGEVLEVRLEGLTVVLPRLAVNACSRISS